MTAHSQTSLDQDLRTALHKAVSKALHNNQFADGWHEMVDPVVDAVLALTAPPRPDHAGGVSSEHEPMTSTDAVRIWELEQGSSPAQAPDKAAEREGVEDTWLVDFLREAFDEGANAASTYDRRPKEKRWSDFANEAFNAFWLEEQDRLAPKPTGTEAGRGVGAGQQVVPADWLWYQLMDWCKARGLPPAEYSDLFAIVGRVRPATPTPDSTGPAGAEADEWATADTTGIRHLRIRLEGALSARREEGDAESVSWLAAGVKALDDALVYATERDQERRGRLIAEGRYEPFRQECKRLEKEMRKAAVLTPSAPIAAPGRDDGPDWREDPSADERWNAGLDYGMTQLCAVLGVNPKSIMWDGATETLDGDVCSAIGRVMEAWGGEDWQDFPTPASDVPGEAQTQEGGR